MYTERDLLICRRAWYSSNSCRPCTASPKVRGGPVQGSRLDTRAMLAPRMRTLSTFVLSQNLTAYKSASFERREVLRG